MRGRGESLSRSPEERSRRTRDVDEGRNGGRDEGGRSGYQDRRGYFAEGGRNEDRADVRGRGSPTYESYKPEQPAARQDGQRPNDDDDEELKGLEYSEFRRLKREKLRKGQAGLIWEITPSPSPSPSRGPTPEREGAGDVREGKVGGVDEAGAEGAPRGDASKRLSRVDNDADSTEGEEMRERNPKKRDRMEGDSEGGRKSGQGEEPREEKAKRKADLQEGESGEGSGSEDDGERGKRSQKGKKKTKRLPSSDDDESEDESDDSAEDDSDESAGARTRKRRRGASDKGRRGRKGRDRRHRRKSTGGKKHRSSKKKSRKEASESEDEESSGRSDGERVAAAAANEGPDGVGSSAQQAADLDPDAVKFKEYLELQRRAGLDLDDEPLVGPAPAPRADGHISYGSAMRPGEGDAIAQFVQQGKRIPRRGEVGLSADEISKFEHLGYVMSGSRHQRMNAIRIRKENQVYSAEDKRALAMFNYEEKAKREHKVMSDLQRLVQRHMQQDAPAIADMVD